MSDPELALVPTEHEGPEAGGAAATASPAAPFTAAEFDAIVGAIWADLDDDPTRIGDLLAEALGLIGSLALRPDLGGPLMPWLSVQRRAAELLRAMEQRALWGPDHEQEDHR